MNLYLKNRFLISTIAFGILLVAIFVLIIIPAISEIRIINKQVLEERIRLEKLYVKGQLQKTVRKNYESVEVKTGFLNKFILDENQELMYVTAIEQSAADEKVDLVISVGETKRKPQQRFSTLNFVFNVSGAWENIARWMEKVEELDYYTNMQEITIISLEKDKEAGTRTATATILADTYWTIP